MNNLKVFISIFILIILVGQVSASILEEHTAQLDIALQNTQTSSITQSIMPYKDYTMACDELVDISVVYYFTLDTQESDNFLDKIFKIVKFDIGKQYRSTHARLACQRALSVAGSDPVLQACGYGICSHLIQDSVSHNKAVPNSIFKTKLFNGIIHSPKEIHDKNLFTTGADWQYSREVLNLAYCSADHSEEGCKIVDYFEDVFINDPALSKVNIPAMVSFFLAQTVPDRGYSLGFQAFFALPAGIYWVILILFFASIATVGLSVRRLRDGQKDATIFFTFFLGFIFLVLVSLTIYGLFSGTIWSIWEVVSQYIFSPILYFVGSGFILIGGYLTYSWTVKPNKWKNIGVLAVAFFVLLLGSYLLTLPTGLTIGNEQALRQESISGLEKLYTQGVTAVSVIQDPVGYDAIKNANASGSRIRTIYILTLMSLLLVIFYSAFKRRKL